jgi:hypothetical protein
MALVGLSALPLLIASSVIAVFRLPQPHLSIWRGDLSTASLVVLPALLVVYHVTWERTVGRRPMLLWQASLTAWRDAWYCSRCHVVFLPERYAGVMRTAGLALAQPPACLQSSLRRLAPLVVGAPGESPR